MHLGKIAAEQPGKAAIIMAGSGQAISFRAELPRLPTGKLLKRMLRDEYARAYTQSEQEASR